LNDWFTKKMHESESNDPRVKGETRKGIK